MSHLAQGVHRYLLAATIFVVACGVGIVSVSSLGLVSIAVGVSIWLIWLIFRNWHFGLYTVAVILPFEDLLVLSPVASVAKIVMGLTLASASLQLLRNPELVTRTVSSLKTEAAVAFGLFTAWSFASTIWSADVAATVQRTVSFLGGFLLMLLTSMLTESQLRRMWGLLAISSGISVLATLLASSWTSSGRFSTGGLDPNDFAGLLVIAMAVFLFGGLATPVSISTLIPTSLGVFLSGSRTGIVAVLATVTLSLFVGGKRRRRLLSVFIAAVVAIAAVGLVSYSQPTLVADLVSRYSSLANLREERTWAGRLDLWHAAARLIEERPITGVGAGSFPSVCEQYSVQCTVINSVRPGGAVAHNMYLSVAAELGLVGLFLFLWVHWSVFRCVFPLRRSNRLAVGVLLGCAAFGVMGQTLTWEYAKIGFLLYGSALALSYADKQKKYGLPIPQES